MECTRSSVWIKHHAYFSFFFFTYILACSCMYQVCLSTYLVCTRFVLVHTVQGFVTVCTRFVLVHTVQALYLTFKVKAWNSICSDVIRTTQFHRSAYHAIVRYCYNDCSIIRHKPVLPGIYHLVQLVKIQANSAFQRIALYIRVHTSAYNSLLCIHWSFLWKAEFARIVTSCTRWDVLGCTSLWRFIAVPYLCIKYILVHPQHMLVHTGMYQVHTSMYLFVSSTYWYILSKCSYNVVHSSNFILVATMYNLVHSMLSSIH